MTSARPVPSPQGTLVFRRSGPRLELHVVAPAASWDFKTALPDLTVLLPDRASLSPAGVEESVLAEDTRASLRFQWRLRHTAVHRFAQAAAIPPAPPAPRITLFLDGSRQGTGPVELGDYRAHWYSPLRTLTLYRNGDNPCQAQSSRAPADSNACLLAHFPDTVVICLKGGGVMAESLLMDQWGIKERWGTPFRRGRHTMPGAGPEPPVYGSILPTARWRPWQALSARGVPSHSMRTGRSTLAHRR